MKRIVKIPTIACDELSVGTLLYRSPLPIISFKELTADSLRYGQWRDLLRRQPKRRVLPAIERRIK